MKQNMIITLLVLLCSGLFAYEPISFQGNTGQWGAYSKDGCLYVNELGTPEEEPLTSGCSDMKPSWSSEGDMLVFFRVTEFNPAVADWKTAICTINTDGTGFRQWTSGEYADFNPTWTRDGTNRIVFSRFDNRRNRSRIILINPEDGVENVVSDPRRSEGVLTCLSDGRMLIASNRSVFRGVYYLLNPDTGEYDRLRFDFPLYGFMDRCSVSPSEKQITYEYKPGWKSFEYMDKTIYIADLDVDTLTVSNPRPISETYRNAMTLYPRFTKDESAIIYHSNFNGLPQLYYYDINQQTTARVSSETGASYEFFCGEDSPK